MKLKLEEIELTDERAESSYKIPVAVIHNKAYGWADIPEADEADPLAWLKECVGCTVACVAKRLGLGNDPFVRKFTQPFFDS